MKSIELYVYHTLNSHSILEFEIIAVFRFYTQITNNVNISKNVKQ
jgi:hypothetical protein